MATMSSQERKEHKQHCDLEFTLTIINLALGKQPQKPFSRHADNQPEGTYFLSTYTYNMSAWRRQLTYQVHECYTNHNNCKTGREHVFDGAGYLPYSQIQRQLDSVAFGIQLANPLAYRHAKEQAHAMYPNFSHNGELK